MDVQLLYFDGCPNWVLLQQRLVAALDRIGRQIPIELVRVTSDAEAERLSFRGSPSLLLDGKDPYGDASAPVGLSCRVYATPEGLQGAPTVEQLVAALASALAAELPSEP